MIMINNEIISISSRFNLKSKKAARVDYRDQKSTKTYHPCWLRHIQAIYCGLDAYHLE